MTSDQDLISLNSDPSEADQSMQSLEDWDNDDQVLDLDVDLVGEEVEDEEDEEEEEEEWGSGKNAFYDADQDSDAEEEEREEALLLQKKMLSKIQESDFEDDFHDSFEHIQSKNPKREKAKVTLDIEKVLSQLNLCIENLNQDSTFRNQLNWIYATILNYYLYLARRGSLKYHPISKVLSKIEKLLPQMDTLDSLKDAQSEPELEDEDAQLHPEEESELDSDYYNTILNRNKHKKLDRENAILQEKKDKREANYALQDSDLINDDEKRMASWKILTNKGLTPHRKKENRNPRVKKRKKYEKAVKKLSSFRAVAVDKAETGPYGGERTGIRRNLTRSIKF